MSFWKKVKQAASSVASAVTAPVKATAAIASGENVLASIKGGISDTIKPVTLANELGSKNIATLDQYTGGLGSSIISANSTLNNIVNDRSIKANIKDTVRVGAVVGTAVLTGGGSIGAQIGTTMAVNNALSGGVNLRSLTNAGMAASGGTGIPIIDNIINAVNNPVSRPAQNQVDNSGNYVGDYSSSLGSTYSISPIVLLAGGVAVIILVVISKRKK